MATTKKTTKATPRTTSKVTTKAAKKAPMKKSSTKKSPTKKSVAQTATMRSFHLAPNQPSFTSFQTSRQTVYWIILIAFIIMAQLWIVQLQIEVAMLIDAHQAQISSM